VLPNLLPSLKKKKSLYPEISRAGRAILENGWGSGRAVGRAVVGHPTSYPAVFAERVGDLVWPHQAA
jgi:hypothetical protein